MNESSILVAFVYLIFVVIGIVGLKLLKRVWKKIPLIIYILLFLSPLVIYIPSELNTLIYGNEFADVRHETGFSSDVVYYKVMSVRDDEATLFYVEGKDGKHEAGNVYYFRKENAIWVLDGWRTIWSNTGGSASENIFPPYF